MECNYTYENLSTNVNRCKIIIDEIYRIKRISFKERIPS